MAWSRKLSKRTWAGFGAFVGQSCPGKYQRFGEAIMTNNAPTQEFLPDGRHRLVSADGTATQWADYGRVAYLNGYVGTTAAYRPAEGVISADEFCRYIGVC